MMSEIKALTFDVGGTVLDWHRGLSQAFADAGIRGGINADWPAITNEYRRRSLQAMVGQATSSFNIDDVHRDVLDTVIQAHDLSKLTQDDREAVRRTWHALDAWPDFPPALARLRQKYVVVAFTIFEHVADRRRVAAQRAHLGCRCLVRDDRCLQDTPGGLSHLREVARIPAGRVPDGRVSQLRSDGSAPSGLTEAPS